MSKIIMERAGRIRSRLAETQGRLSQAVQSASDPVEYAYYMKEAAGRLAEALVELTAWLEEFEGEETEARYIHPKGRGMD